LPCTAFIAAVATPRTVRGTGIVPTGGACCESSARRSASPIASIGAASTALVFSAISLVRAGAVCAPVRFAPRSVGFFAEAFVPPFVFFVAIARASPQCTDASAAGTNSSPPGRHAQPFATVSDGDPDRFIRSR
jgi:hypothetical protein